MELKIYQVDAFSDQLFHGNPAAVIPLESWLPDDLMQNIAQENNLSETAYYVPNGNQFEIRWFTPNQEVRLCGHATLATAHVLFQHKKYPQKTISFQSKSGILMVEKRNKLYTMNFPTDEIRQVTCPHEILTNLNIKPVETFVGKDDYMVILNTQKEIEDLRPDFGMLCLLEKTRGVIFTAPGNDADFVSRCFYPSFGINEDPATGSAHTTMTPYWAKRLSKNELKAVQLSPRKGYFTCEYLQERVALSGQAITYMTGEIRI